MSLPKDAVAADTVIHPVNVLGDARKEMVLVTRERVRIWGYDGGKVQLLQDLALPAPQKAGGKTYYTFARIDETPYVRLVLAMPDGLYFVPGENNQLSAAPVRLVSRQLIQGETAGKPIQHFSFALDLNNDGFDEFLLPEQNGFSIFRLTGEGQLAQVPLPRNPYKRTDIFDLHRHLGDDPSRMGSISGSITKRRGVENLLIFDANGDKLQDLIYATTVAGPESKQNEKYEVFVQRRDLTFETKPSQVMEVPYEMNSDVTFRDLNNDKRLDALVVRSNFDLLNPRTIVKIYIAKSQNQVFTRETDRFITKDPIGIVRVADFNADGMSDFAMTFFSYQFGSTEDMVSIILENKLNFKLQFYLGKGERGFNRQPEAEKELSVTMRTESYGGYPPIYLSDDINGDKFMDLLVRSSEDVLAFYPSDGALAFPRDAAFRVDVPSDAAVDFADVDGDGVKDVIVSSPVKQHLTVHFVRAN